MLIKIEGIKGMGIFEGIKKTVTENLPDVVTNPEISGQANEMIYKFDKVALIKGSRLIVGPSQEAIFVRNGIIDAVFEPGSYNLETDNIPIAKQLLTMAYGGSSPNRAEIWFINKAVAMDVSWGTPAPLTMEERKFGVPLTIKVRCNGSINLRIVDSTLMFKEMVGQGKVFSIENFKIAMRGMMVSRLQKTLGEHMKTSDEGFVALQQGITIIEKPLQEAMQKELDAYGLRIEGCYVKGFTVVEDDSWERYKRYEEEYFKIQVDATRIERLAQAEAHRFETLGTNYKMERQFNVMDSAASNEGSAAMAAPLMMGVGLSTGKTIGEQMGTMTNSMFADARTSTQPQQVEPSTNGQVFCTNCGGANSKTSKFCCECGQLMKVSYTCSNCGFTTDNKTKFCPECGNAF